MKRDEFELLYNQCYEKVWRLCLGYSNGDEFAADDLAQEVFANVWLHWDSFRGEAQRSTWLFRIAVNTSLSRKRKLNKQPPAVRMNEAQYEQAEEEYIPQQHTVNQLYQCINQLDGLDKSIIMLELEGLPQKEIAEVTGKSHASIRTRVHRIKEKLKNCLSHG